MKADRALLKRRRAMIVGRGTHNDEATTTLLSFLAKTKDQPDEEYVCFYLIIFLQ